MSTLVSSTNILVALTFSAAALLLPGLGDKSLSFMVDQQRVRPKVKSPLRAVSAKRAFQNNVVANGGFPNRMLRGGSKSLCHAFWRVKMR
jgi:hypothetical protein